MTFSHSAVLWDIDMVRLGCGRGKGDATRWRKRAQSRLLSLMKNGYETLRKYHSEKRQWYTGLGGVFNISVKNI